MFNMQSLAIVYTCEGSMTCGIYLSLRLKINVECNQHNYLVYMALKICTYNQESGTSSFTNRHSDTVQSKQWAL